MLTSALVNMTPERKKAIADAIYAWLPKLSDLQRIKNLFDSLPIFYVIKPGENGFVNLYITSEKEAIVQRLETDDHPEIAGLRHYQMFEFENEKLVSY